MFTWRNVCYFYGLCYFNSQRVLTWDFVLGGMKSFHFDVWSISSNCLYEIPRNETHRGFYFIAIILTEMKLYFGWKMLCKHYPEMKSYENKHLRMRILREHTIGIAIVEFELQSKMSCAKEKKHYLAVFPSESST